ncbi:MAG TPA: hypothetical protein VGS07_08960 [Thermoanaerobaculia bacterium]|jgi:hypothetical protein|nr:hypothetical protein [Thermoanaerobaculia bacterium]
MSNRKVFSGLLVLSLAAAGAASAQTLIALPDSSQSTTLTASVPEQARVLVPPNITFNVNDVAANTPADPASISVSNIVLSTSTKKLRIAIQADTASFTAPVSGATTWVSSNVTWNNASWTHAAGASGTLTDVSFNAVAECNADTSDCSTNALVFTLAANSSVKRSGNHTLGVHWKFESFEP